MKLLKHFNQYYLSAAYKLAMTLLKHPESAPDVCKLSIKNLIESVSVDSGINLNLLMTEHQYYCQLIWKDVTALIEFFYAVERTKNIRINHKQSKIKYISQANKVYNYIIENTDHNNRKFSLLAASLLGEVHFQFHGLRQLH
jgi:hypothetical protein